MAAAVSLRPSLRPGGFGSGAGSLTGSIAKAAPAESAAAASAPAAANGETPFFSLNPKITDQEAKALSPSLSASALEEVGKTNPKLGATWTVWEQMVLGKQAGQYSDATRQLISFNTAKDFWACFNHLPQPSELLDGKKFTREKEDGQRVVVDSLMIFRKGIQPEWEDPANKQGGHFEIKLKPSLGAGVIDELWNNIVLGMITGAIAPADMLSGVRLVDKLKGTTPMIRIEVWFNDMDPDDTGRLYELRGSFERCMRTALNGEERTVTWGYTQTKSHSGEETAAPRARAPRR